MKPKARSFCSWCLRDNLPSAPIEFRRTKISTGDKVNEFCTGCDRPINLGHSFAKSLFTSAELAAMPWTNSDPGEACEICGGIAHLENHHLAPRAQFGAEAEKWPIVRCCRPCHAFWHLKMGQPIDDEDEKEAAEE